MRGGVLTLAIFLLALSLTFTACSDGGDDNSNSNPSPTLPGNEGKNPFFEEDSNESEEETNVKSIKLNIVPTSGDGWETNNNFFFFILQSNGIVTLYNNYSDDEPSPYSEFKYTYKTDKSEIYMRLERVFLEINGDTSFYTYDELLSPSSKYFANDKKNYIQYIKENLENNYKSNLSLQENYPDYKDYENAYLKESGYTSFDEKYEKEILPESKYYFDKAFSILTTYKYEINKDNKILLTEKFTGIKNIGVTDPGCEYNDDSISLTICNDEAYLRFYKDSEDISYYSEYYVPFESNKITFYHYEYDEDKDIEIPGDSITATYEENLEKEVVIVTIDGKDYTCKFQGLSLIQE